MLFNSYSFLLLFLPVACVTFFAAGALGSGAGCVALLASSFVFYGWWSLAYLPLLGGSILGNFLAGHSILRFRAAGQVKAAGWVLQAGVLANLLLLGYYKYVGFFITTINEISEAQLRVAKIALPIGISFFTFTQIAYIVDCMRGKAVRSNIVHYALFVSYFPHLIAGPILHHSQMIRQFQDRRIYRFDWGNIELGLTMFALGLAKKVLLADNLAGPANGMFSAAGAGNHVGFSYAWVGALSYTMQLYFDFSGYSDMAIGISLLFNIRLPINFDSPYKSRSIIEFWRRWHMTLSSFLRDYLYIPLGGNRRGTLRRYMNLLLTMLLGGLWHGAGWTFLIWGGLHGLFLTVNNIWSAFKPRSTLLVSVERWASGPLVFLCVVMAWVVFRAESASDAITVLRTMSGLNGVDLGQLTFHVDQVKAMAGELLAAVSVRTPLPDGSMDLGPAALQIVACCAIVWCLPNSQQIVGLAPERTGRFVRLARPACAGVLIGLGVMSMTGSTEFIYFNF